MVFNRENVKPGQLSPGCWNYIEYGGWTGETLRVTIAACCPNCKRLFCLAKHIITQRSIQPSVVCPWHCSFHAFVTLGGPLDE